MRHIVLVGPQGAGKGTQAAAIAPARNLVHLSTGDLLRELMAGESELASEVRGYVDSGELVPDKLMARILFAALDARAAESKPAGALIDGFPRNASQAVALEDAIESRGESLEAVVHIAVPRDVLMSRLTGRLICRGCGRSYHVHFNPPKIAGVCDVCGGELYTRSDDTEDAVARRLEIYFSETEPLLERWRARDLVLDIDGNQDIDAVTAEILAALGDLDEA